MTVSGTPQLELTVGTQTVTANYVSGPDTPDLVFTYSVQPGVEDLDGVAINSLGLNGGTIVNTVVPTVAANLTLTSIASTAGVLVDGPPSVVIGSYATEGEISGSPRVFGAFDIAVTFSEPITGFELSDITVTDGSASNFAGSGDTYTATIVPDRVGDNVMVTVGVGAGVAEDAGGNANTAASLVRFDAGVRIPRAILEDNRDDRIGEGGTIPAGGSTLLRARIKEDVALSPGL